MRIGFWLGLSVSLAMLGCPGQNGGSKTGSGGGSNHPLLRKVAPDVQVKRSKGPWKPSDTMGKVVVMDFWATWCAPCKASFPKLDAIYKKHKDAGLVVVAINEDEDGKGVDQFVKDTGVSFQIALDPNGTAASTYGVDTMPTEFILDRRGIVRYVHAGYHPDDVEAVDAEVQELLKEPP